MKVRSLFKKRPVQKADIEPFVSIIITAYNEEARIKEKIENTLNFDYPRDKREIIVASDCSTDKTDDIARSFESHGVRLVRPDERKGKEYAQMHAVKEAKGEILIFTDTATIIGPDAIREMVKNFADDSVGCVSSEDKTITETGEVEGEGLYVKYEMALRNAESAVYSLVGLSGSFFAARKEVCEDWQPFMQSDFNTLINSVRGAKRGVIDPKVCGFYAHTPDAKKEFERKIRTVVRGIHVFMSNWQTIKRSPLSFRFQIISHKLIRWMVPFSLMDLLWSNACLVGDRFYRTFFLCQLAFYGAAFSYKYVKHGLLRIPYFFVSVNIAIAIAWHKYSKGERYTVWNPTKR